MKGRREEDAKLEREDGLCLTEHRKKKNGKRTFHKKTKSECKCRYTLEARRYRHRQNSLYKHEPKGKEEKQVPTVTELAETKRK